MVQTIHVGERRLGVRSAVRAARHLYRIAGLERELAAAELRRKGTRTATGVGLAGAAAVLAPYAVGLALAALVAALALAVAVWLALLIVLALVLVVIVALLAVSRALVGGSRPFTPERALEEARLLRKAVQDPDGR